MHTIIKKTIGSRILSCMNNKIGIQLLAPFSYDTAGRLAFNGSALDELVMFSNEILTIAATGPTTNGALVDTNIIPENLSDVSAVFTQQEFATRQDVKRRVAVRLPRVTLGQGLVTLSAADNFSAYFINSIVMDTGCGFLRFGIANFTADQATNPFTAGNEGTLQCIWGFFDLEA